MDIGLDNPKAISQPSVAGAPVGATPVRSGACGAPQPLTMNAASRVPAATAERHILVTGRFSQ